MFHHHYKIQQNFYPKKYVPPPPQNPTKMANKVLQLTLKSSRQLAFNCSSTITKYGSHKDTRHCYKDVRTLIITAPSFWNILHLTNNVRVGTFYQFLRKYSNTEYTFSYARLFDEWNMKPYLSSRDQWHQISNTSIFTSKIYEAVKIYMFSIFFYSLLRVYEYISRPL